MKPNFKLLDQTDPEIINTHVTDNDLHEISKLLQKRRSAQTGSKKFESGVLPEYRKIKQ